MYDGSWVTQAWVVGLRPSGAEKPMMVAALALTVWRDSVRCNKNDMCMSSTEM